MSKRITTILFTVSSLLTVIGYSIYHDYGSISAAIIISIFTFAVWFISRPEKELHVSLSPFFLFTISTLCTSGVIGVVHFFNNGLSMESVGGFITALININIAFVFYAAVTFVVYVLGKAALSCIGLRMRDEKWLRRCIASALGFVIIAVAYFCLALLHIVSVGLWLLAIVAIMGLVHYRKTIWRYVSSPIPLVFSRSLGSRVVSRSWGILFIVIIFSTLCATSFFPLAYSEDDKRTYANIPLSIIEQNEFVEYPLDSLNQAPNAATYVLLPFLQLSSDRGSLFYIYFTLLTALVIAAHFIKKNQTYAALSGLVVYTLLITHIPNLITRRPDGLVAFLLLLSVLILLSNGKEYFKKILVVGILMGFAVAIKYPALIAFPALYLLVFIHKGITWKSLHYIALVSICAAISFLPWALHSTYRYGNPIHPIIVSLDRAEIASSNIYQTNSTNNSRRASTLVSGYLSEFELNHYSINNETDFFDRLSIIAWQHSDIWAVNQVGPILILALLAAPVLSRRRTALAILLASVLTIVLWHALGINQFHYISYILPWIVLSLCYIACLPYRRGLLVFVGLAFFYLYSSILFSSPAFHLSAMQASDKERFRQLYSETAFACLTRQLNDIELREPEYRVFSFTIIDNVQLFNQPKHYYSNYFGAAWLDVVAESEREEDTIHSLRNRGITHVVYPLGTESYFTCARNNCPTLEYLNERQQLLRGRLELVSDECGYIYRVPRGE